MSCYLRAHGVGLDLPVYTQDQRSLRATASVLLRAAFSPPKRELRTTLDDISFDLAPGDKMAVLGVNGAGKSTLLKVLVGAYMPSRGVLDVSGSRQALLNLSLGFIPDGTVIENIILRGIAMGLKPREAAALIDEVLDFSELGEKAGDRLRTLSSGQRMRLGFSLATSIKHDILLMDEWLGTGDAAFVDKAKTRIRDRVNEAQIVVLASHNLKLLDSVCNTAILLDQGKIVARGATADVISEYRQLLKRPARTAEA